MVVVPGLAVESACIFRACASLYVAESYGFAREGCSYARIVTNERPASVEPVSRKTRCR